jgi:hypothetical protein
MSLIILHMYRMILICEHILYIENGVHYFNTSSSINMAETCSKNIWDDQQPILQLVRIILVYVLNTRYIYG